jgi:hypothetical protein
VRKDYFHDLSVITLSRIIMVLFVRYGARANMLKIKENNDEAPSYFFHGVITRPYKAFTRYDLGAYRDASGD